LFVIYDGDGTSAVKPDGPPPNEGTGAPIAFEPPPGTKIVISALSRGAPRREDAYAGFAKYSAAFNVCLVVALVALIALSAFDDPRQFHEVTPKRRPSPSAFIDDQPRLLVEDQEGGANEPLPLGATVQHTADGATVTFEGLPDGVELSLGNRSDNRDWTVAVTDLEKTFVGAPLGFVGVIETTATLRAASGRLLDRQVLRFAWRANKDELPGAAKEIGPATTPAPTPSTQSPPANSDGQLPRSATSSAVASPPPATSSALTGGEAIECKSAPPAQSKAHWAWRLVDNKKCWYAGLPGAEKTKLHWPANTNHAPQPAARGEPAEVTDTATTPPSGVRQRRRPPKSTAPQATGWGWP
jgi:hypothetical protein